jgi:hypothetical protein
MIARAEPPPPPPPPPAAPGLEEDLALMQTAEDVSLSSCTRASMQPTSPTHTAPPPSAPSQRLFEALRLAADAADALGGGDATAADAASAAFLAATAGAQAAMLALTGRHGTPAPRAADGYAARLGGAADAAAARGAAAGGADAAA